MAQQQQSFKSIDDNFDFTRRNETTMNNITLEFNNNILNDQSQILNQSVIRSQCGIPSVKNDVNKSYFQSFSQQKKQKLNNLYKKKQDNLIFKLSNGDYQNLDYRQTVNTEQAIFLPKMPKNLIKSKSVSNIDKGSLSQLSDFKFKYKNDQLHKHFNQRYQKNQNLQGLNVIGEEEYLKDKKNNNNDSLASHIYNNESTIYNMTIMEKQDLHKKYKLPDYNDDTQLLLILKNLDQKQTLDEQMNLKKELSRTLLKVNKDSPLETRVKNITTLGRNGQDFLKFSRFRDNQYYCDNLYKDKINNLDKETKQFIKSGSNNQLKIGSLSKSQSNGQIIKDRMSGGLKQNQELRNQELINNFKYISQNSQLIENKKYKTQSYENEDSVNLSTVLRLKKQNLYRNLNSNNPLSCAIRQSNQSLLERDLERADIAQIQKNPQIQLDIQNIFQNDGYQQNQKQLIED